MKLRTNLLYNLCSTRYYRFDYKKAKPNRFAARMKNEPLIVMIEPDVAKVFTSAEQMNKAFKRAVIHL